MTAADRSDATGPCAAPDIDISNPTALETTARFIFTWTSPMGALTAIALLTGVSESVLRAGGALLRTC